ncbi:class I SAM-dependent methyltransferase [Streptomyces sp. Z26]|uniref:class I SAM-dependent methyltransferase n=1 Tax=Streptomyces TaxID=1883 RepID=UPI000EF13F96|nr:class I SAM-dependent methyltransferase [Streptomyces sp. Z26]RLL69564.1 class I SAM-dependent methyltransferase [Streptomyces sp. Z26]
MHPNPVNDPNLSEDDPVLSLASRAGQTPNALAWENFWRDAPPEEHTVFWDAPQERTGAVHLPLLAPYFGGGRPVVDVGCGNGSVTRFLAGHYGRVIGVDVSAEAVSRARDAASGDEGAGTALAFRQLDATDIEAVGGLRTELAGDADVYVRGVLHQCSPGDRPRLAASVAALVGERGRVFVVEPAAEGGAALTALSQRAEGPPSALAAVLAHGIRPMEMPDESLPALFGTAGLDVLARGAVPLALTVVGPDGESAEVASNWLVAGRNG